MTIDYQYAMLLMPQLSTDINNPATVKKTNPLLINCRCQLCGDSKTNTFKSRGYIIEESNGKYYYYCHNCRVSMPLSKFIQHINPSLYQQYRMDRFKLKEDDFVRIEENRRKKDVSFESIGMLEKVSKLKPGHIAYDYCYERKIPSKFYGNLFYCKNFYEFLMSIDPESAEKTNHNDERLVIPYLNPQGKVPFLTGRSLLGSELRYLTVVFDETELAVYGIERLDFNKQIYITEGPIDSMFIDNGIAIGGQHYTQYFEDYIAPYKDKVVFVFDNEPRNKHTIKAMRRAINGGYGMFIWPSSMEGNKDINDVVLNNPETNVNDLLAENTFSGMIANLQLAKWTKV